MLDMNTERFNVVLDGATLRGQNVATVAAALAQLINRDIDFASSLLRGQPTKIKSGVNAVTGARYVAALERIGAAVRLEPETLEVDAELSVPITDKHRQTASLASQRAPAGTPPQSADAPKAQLATATAPQPEVTMETFYKAWVGPTNQAFYLNYFSKAERAAERSLSFLFSWHWPAFFATLPWLLYRKMFLGAILYFGGVFVAAAYASYEVAVNRSSGNVPEMQRWAIIFVVILVLSFVLPAVMANGIYYRHVFSKMRAANVAHREIAHQLREAAISGGTSWVAVVVGLFIYWCFVAAVRMSVSG